MPAWHGQIQDSNGNWQDSNGYDITTASVCGEITFADADKVNGPFHSNDDIRVNGSPDFGRPSNADAVEVANLLSSDPGWRDPGETPVFHTPNGKLTNQAGSLNLPPSNSAIKAQAKPGYLYTGPTTIVLKGATMDVTTGGSTTTGVALPANGVIYVQNSACAFGYKPQDTQAVDPGCGVTSVSGSYSEDLTIASADDVIVNGSITRASGSNAVLGLVADKFVRVWHPVLPRPRSGSSCTNQSGSLPNVQIDAAILAVNHSFTVDNYDCGALLGTLTVNGVIAQKHRGIVAVGAPDHGYIKNYVYDDRLKYRSPPYFLDPVQAAWGVLRENDQSGAQ
jgi:hypothetical protein